ncbi:gluconate kinase (SKI family) [Mesocricetibacter intestinalis]|uniref:Gluconokinase n=1 Tax=Mesocricetibacter intestinalis TaxID=1521930 RepID=A0A4R6VG31_9PAST|nr:gluconokinase [Mesocricetibacter intestinalis]TDQ59759.1 gluconate kinase (SKI family) [Mesocricetibacter intestinalis]
MHKSGKSFILMGVSSTGKTSVGTAIAEKLGLKLIDGDDLHPRANIIKMASGQPLNDEDRAPWLERIRDAAFSLEQKSEKGIIICSALKKKYRDQIREGNDVKFIFLKGDFDLVLARMQKRQGHYMKADMLRSQFATLEIPQAEETDVYAVDIDAGFDEVVARCVAVIEPLLK